MLTWIALLLIALPLLPVAWTAWWLLASVSAAASWDGRPTP
jgi:hypothetical protein